MSLVVNPRAGASAKVAPATRDRVLRAVQATGYGSGEQTRSVGLIGVVAFLPAFPSAADSYFRPFLAGVEEHAQVSGVDVVHFTATHRHTAVAGDHPAGPGQRSLGRIALADGCLLLGDPGDMTGLRPLLDLDYPFVFIGERHVAERRLPYVGADYRDATRRCTANLIGLGHRRIGFVGATDLTPSRLRLAGFREAMADAGLTETLIAEDDLADAAHGPNRVTAALVDATCMIDDLLAALAESKIIVPDDLSLMLLGQAWQPQQSPRRFAGFRVPGREIGAAATALLLERLRDDRRSRRNGRRSRHRDGQRLPCPLVSGDTLGPPR